MFLSFANSDLNYVLLILKRPKVLLKDLQFKAIFSQKLFYDARTLSSVLKPKCTFSQ